MASYNKVILIGNLTRDPEKRYTQGGTCVVNIGLAVNRRTKKNEEWVDEVSFFDIVVFGVQAENCAKFLAKGRPALVDGELQQRRWETPEGQKRSKVEIVASRVAFLGGRDEGGSQQGQGGGGQGQGGGSQQSEGQGAPPDDGPPLGDDIPF